jgi:hypothetical protein
MEKYAEYRARFPETIQIVLNHTDMSRRPYAVPYWRPGDPILYRTPAYDRSELAPFPPAAIFPYERMWENIGFPGSETKYAAGFIGTPSGPPGYRDAVARETARVGFGRCDAARIPRLEYIKIMASCKIIVCPQGWGENSRRHWDAWISCKPVLTDRACDSVEMIPGMRLRDKVHYLVYDDPTDIPDIVTDWTRPDRADDLSQIALNGWRAASGYDPCGRIERFFRKVQSREPVGEIPT